MAVGTVLGCWFRRSLEEEAASPDFAGGGDCGSRLGILSCRFVLSELAGCALRNAIGFTGRGSDPAAVPACTRLVRTPSDGFDGRP